MDEKKEIIKSMLFEQSKKIYLTLIGILFTYSIANYLGPEGYGEIIFLISFTGSIQTLMGIALFENVIFIFINKYKNRDLFNKLIKYNFLTNIILVFFLLILTENILILVNLQNVFLFRIAALLLIPTSIYVCFTALCKAFKAFGKLLKVQSLMQTIELVLAIFFIMFLGIGNSGVVFAQFLAILFILPLLFKYYKRFRYSERRFDYKDEIKTYLKPVIPTYWLRRFEDSFTLIVIGILFQPLLMGYYYFAKKLNDAVVGKAINTVKEVFQAYTIEKWNQKTLLEKYISNGIRLDLIISTTIGILVLLLINPFIYFLMPAYIDSIMLIMLFVVNSILNSFLLMEQVFIALNKMNIYLKIRIIAILIYIPSLIFLSISYSLYGLVISAMLNVSVLAVLYYHYSKSLGINLELIPTKKDIVFLINFLKFNNIKFILQDMLKK